MNRLPVEMLDSFIKAAAAEVAKPYGISDAGRATRQPVQRYAKPQAPAAVTRPDISASQQSIPPPPVQ